MDLNAPHPNRCAAARRTAYGLLRLIVIGALLAGCSSRGDAVQVVKSDSLGVHVRIGEAQGNVMPTHFVGPDHLHEPRLPDAAPQQLATWTPTVADIRQAERGLESFLEKALQGRSGPFGGSEARYIHRHATRQYYGMVIDGRRVLHVELISGGVPFAQAGKDDSWRVRQVNGVDMSTDWIWFYYDPEKGEYFGYGNTGEA